MNFSLTLRNPSITSRRNFASPVAHALQPRPQMLKDELKLQSELETPFALLRQIRFIFSSINGGRLTHIDATGQFSGLRTGLRCGVLATPRQTTTTGGGKNTQNSQ